MEESRRRWRRHQPESGKKARARRSGGVFLKFLEGYSSLDPITPCDVDEGGRRSSLWPERRGGSETAEAAFGAARGSFGLEKRGE